MGELSRQSSFDPNVCPSCNGEGYTFLIYGQLDTYEECKRCEGTGDRFGRGRTQPVPTEASDG
jgi:DnaJ-class molecular chaperone